MALETTKKGLQGFEKTSKELMKRIIKNKKKIKNMYYMYYYEEA